MPGQRTSFVSPSLWQIPQACTLIRTCPAPGLGISRSTIWKSAPGLGICAAFIGAIATFIVAINPPLNLMIVEEHLPFSFPMNVKAVTGKDEVALFDFLVARVASFELVLAAR